MSLERERWSSKTEFLLCCLNLCVGLGNVSLFPYLVYDNGGLVFLAVYVILLCAMGLPMLYLEIFLGQFSGCSMPGAFGGFPMAKGVGWTMVYADLCMMLYNVPLLASCFVYLASSLLSELPWNSCGERHVQEYGCYQIQPGIYPCGKVNATMARRYSSRNYSGADGIAVSGGDLQPVVTVPLQEYAVMRDSCINGTASAARVFFDRRMIHLGSTLEDAAHQRVESAVAMVVVWGLGFFAICFGSYYLRKASATVIFIEMACLALLCVMSSTLSGAKFGIITFFRPDPSKALLRDTWYSAARHMFFSLSLSVGVLTFFASRNDFHWPIFGTALNVAVVDVLFGLFAGCVEFSLYGHLADSYAVSFGDMVTKGVDYLFVTFPESIQPLSMPHIWAVAFYGILTAAICGSQFCILAAIVGTLSDLYPVLGDRPVLSSFVACLGVFVIGLPLAVIDDLEQLRQLVNRVVRGNFILLVGFAEVFSLAYGYGAGRLVNDIAFMFDERPPAILPFCWRFVCPTILALTGVGILTSDAADSESIHISPQWASPAEIGAFAAIFILFGAFALATLANNKYDLYAALEPQRGYGPRDPVLCSGYRAFLLERNAVQGLLVETEKPPALDATDGGSDLPVPGPLVEAAKPPALDATDGWSDLPAPRSPRAGDNETEENGAGAPIARSDSTVMAAGTVITAPGELSTLGAPSSAIGKTRGATTTPVNLLDATNKGAEPSSTSALGQR